MEEQVKTPPVETSDTEQEGGEEPKEGKLTQEEVDKVVQARLERQKEADEKKFQEMLRKEREQWEKQSKMSQEEREQEFLKQKEAENAEKERTLTLRENKLNAIEILEEKGVPQASKVAEFLVDVDEETQRDNVNSFIEMVKEITEAITDKELRGVTPKAVEPTRGETVKEVPFRL